VNPFIISAIAARLGPFIGRVGKTQPGFISSLVSRLRAAGASVGDKASDVVAYFRQSPVTAALTLSTIAGLGVSASDLLKGLEESDPDLRSFIDGLDSTTMKARVALGQEAHMAIQKVGSQSESLDVQIHENEMDLIAAREVLSWAKSHFGSAQAAMKSHRLMQAFVEMPYSDVVTGFEHLRV
jgi:hypothetical protein